MFGCGSDAVLQEDAEALEAPPEGEAFGLVPRVCFHLLHRLHETNTGRKNLLGVERAMFARDLGLPLGLNICFGCFTLIQIDICCPEPAGIAMCLAALRLCIKKLPFESPPPSSTERLKRLEWLQ